MDVNFHYFAVRTLALKAGFLDAPAQRIAEYSQFVDDYNWFIYIKCSNIPNYAKSPEYDLVVSSPIGNFNPAQTGFSDWLDYALLILPRNQRFIVSPFHFLPKNKSLVKEETRTTPATVHDASLIDSLLLKAIADYKEHILQKKDVSIQLMQVGMLLHTFADTYAHQLFSGYNSWVNDVKVTQVKDNSTDEDITNHVLAENSQDSDSMDVNNDNSLIPCIGHAKADNVPDLTNVSFTMQYKSKETVTGYDSTYSRSNTETFLTASRQILNYLRMCLNKSPISDMEWEAIRGLLARGFLVKMPEKNVEETLARHWKSVFPDISYRYNKTEIENSFYEDKSKNLYTESFYQYNCMADRVLIELYGVHPRR
jgi:hypothetical protein